MSVSEDYAGGSWKSNAELEAEVENLQNQVSAAQDKIISLESDVENLKNLIRRLDEAGPTEVNFQGWEVFSVLREWANGTD